MIKQTITFAVVKKNNVIQKAGNSIILVPKVKSDNHQIKWFDDNKLIRK